MIARIVFCHTGFRSHAISTSLTSIPGVGEVRARELLRRFGSLAAVREATVEELLTVKPTTVEEITERYRKPKRRK